MDYTVKRSGRRTVALEISPEGKIIVRAPYFYPSHDIEKLIASHADWIAKTIEKVKSRPPQKVLSEQEINEKKKIAEERIVPRAKYYSKLMNLYPTGIKITAARKRYGSCSAKNSLCFSYMLADHSDRAIDYVVIHELAHIKYKNHGRNFYSLIEKYMPDYKSVIKEMKNK